MFPKFHLLDDSFCERMAFKNFILGLVVIRRPHIDGKDLFQIDNLRVVNIDLKGGGSSIHRSRCEALNEAENHGYQDQSDDHPFSFLEDPQVIPKMNFFFLLNGKIGESGRWRKLIIFGRRDFSQPDLLLLKTIGMKTCDLTFKKIPEFDEYCFACTRRNEDDIVFF